MDLLGLEILHHCMVPFLKYQQSATPYFFLRHLVYISLFINSTIHFKSFDPATFSHTLLYVNMMYMFYYTYQSLHHMSLVQSYVHDYLCPWWINLIVQLSSTLSIEKITKGVLQVLHFFSENFQKMLELLNIMPIFGIRIESALVLGRW